MLHWAALFLGIGAGMLAGLIPGLHVNLAVGIASLIPLPADWLATFILSMAFAQSVYDYFPNASIGIPSEETILTLLPAQQLAKQGFLLGVLRLSILSSLLAGGCILLLGFTTIIPFIIRFLSQIFIPPAKIVFLTFLLILPHVRPTRLGLILLVLSGVLGSISLSKGWIMPLLAGLFGMPMIIILLHTSPASLPFRRVDLPFHAPTFLVSLPIGMLMSFLPGVGSAYAVYLTMLFAGFTRRAERLVIVNSSVSTITYAMSLPTLFLLGNARNGAVAFLKEMQFPLSYDEALRIGLLSLSIAAMSAWVLSSLYARLVSKLTGVHMRSISFILLLLTVSLTLLLHGLAGVSFLITATLVGVLAVQAQQPRIILLASLLVPVLLLLIGPG